MPVVTFKPVNISLDMPVGASLLEGARRAGVFIETPCGGKGTCKRCRVRLTENGVASDVLICRASVGGEPVTVEVPEASVGEGRFGDFNFPVIQPPQKTDPFIKKIKLTAAPPAPLDGLSDADRLERAFIDAAGCESLYIPLSLLRTLPGRLRMNNGEVTVYYYPENDTARAVSIGPEKIYGIAADIGTTTVALWLTDLESGEIISARTAYNDQIECGADIISRINYAKNNLKELNERVLRTVNALIENACNDAGAVPEDIVCVSVAGNTTMTHLLLGIVPEYIRLSPYTPAVFTPPVYTARRVGFNINGEAPVLFAPAVGSYVGGDVAAGLLCTEFGSGEGVNDLTLYIDIGTNGEIALGNDEFLFACACSAGPAFEGGGIRHGVRAGAGAIERVIIDDNNIPEVFTIGGAPPIGICGSGIISAVAELFKKKIVDSAGRFPEKNAEYALSDGITINSADIDNFIRAKGAIFAACQTLIDSVGMKFSDVKKFYVAGGFGRFLNLEDARTVGLLPRLPDENFSFLGNSSVAGAYLAMVSGEYRARMRGLADRITYVDLSGEPGYMERYTAALFLPHTDQKLFD